MATIVGSSTLTTLSSFIKRTYPEKRVPSVAMRPHPTLSKMPKADDFVGESGGMHIPIQWEDPSSVSADITKVLSSNGNPNATKQDHWLLTRKKFYGVVEIDNELIHAARNDMGAFLRARKSQVDGALRQMGNRMSSQLFGDGGGTIGTISAIGDGDGTDDLITLTNAEDALKFKVGGRYQVATAATGGSLRTGNNGFFVCRKVDEDNAQIWVGDAAGAAADVQTQVDSGVTTGDFIVPEGDYDSAATGFAGWLPTTAPSSGESFFGVDRSFHPTRLAGHRQDGSAVSLEEGLIKLGEKIKRAGNTETPVAVMSYAKFGDLLLEATNRVQRDPGGSATLGFESATVYTPSGPMKAMPDQDCPEDRVYALTPSSWKIHTLRPAPHFADEDGLRALRTSDGDEIEIRLRTMWGIVCMNPGKNGVLHSL